MLSIAVLHYNHPELTDLCCTSVETQALIHIEHEKLLLDNGSTIPYTRDGWRVVRLETNRGNVGGQNACFDHARGDDLLFVSNDVQLHAGCITNLLDFAARKVRWGQIQPVIYAPNGIIQNAGMDYRWPGYGIGRTTLVSERTPIVPSICYLFSKSLWAATEGFDEALPMAYEDVDMGLQWQDRPSFVAPLAKVTHLGNATLQYTAKDRWRFHQARRMVIRKHFTGFNRDLRLGAESLIHGVLSASTR